MTGNDILAEIQAVLLKEEKMKIICQTCCKEIEGQVYHSFVCDDPAIDEVLYTHTGECYRKFKGENIGGMRFKKGDRVVVDEKKAQPSQRGFLEDLDPSYVVTISHIESDPHSDKYMYFFNEVQDGWYDCEVVGLYVEDERIKNRFEILDL